MVAYWVARSKVNNPDRYKKYTGRVPGILQKFGVAGDNQNENPVSRDTRSSPKFVSR